MNFSYYCHFTTPLSLVVLISMIFACELNPENLIGVRIKPRQTQPNVSFFACANIQFRKPWKSFNYLCTPCPIHQALLFQFGKIHWILFFFGVFCLFFSSLPIAANHFYSKHFFLTFSVCTKCTCESLFLCCHSLYFFFSNMNTNCHVMSFHYLSDTPIKWMFALWYSERNK